LLEASAVASKGAARLNREADRLLRAIAHSGHHITISIHAMQRRFKETPTITVLRYDRYGRLTD